MRGNVVDMAVGIIIGASFRAIVSSFVADVIMPPIGLLLGGRVDFTNLFLTLKAGEKIVDPYASLADAKQGRGGGDCGRRSAIATAMKKA